MVWPGAGASSGGAGLSVACPVQGPAQQLCTVGGLGKCRQKSAGMGPWAWGPRQVSRRRRMPSPQETEHWQEKGRGVGLTRPEDDKDGGGHRPGTICCDVYTALEADTCPRSPDEVALRRSHGGGAGAPARVSATLEASASPHPRAGLGRHGRLLLHCGSLQPGDRPAPPRAPTAPAQVLRVLPPQAGGGSLHRLLSTP